MLAPDLVLQGRYRIVEALGRGGMGVVYRAVDQTFGSTVAIKQTRCDGADLEKAFQREARLLNGLRHAALPVVIDYFSEARGQFLVMQYIPGDDFGALLDRRREPYEPERVMAWADQLLDALQYLHEHDPPVIHRDIKPRNLKLTPRGEVVLLDFGLSKSMPVDAEAAAASVSVLGYTAQYAPFEQIQGQGTDARSDLFSLAATLYHLLTATLPPDAMMRALATTNGKPDPLRPAHVVHAAVPPALGALVHAGMAMARDQRPPSAAAMRASLAAIRGGRTLVVPADAAAEAATVVAPDGSPTALGRPSTIAPRAATSVPPETTRPRAPRWLAAAGVAGMVAAIGLVMARPGRAPAPPAAVPPAFEEHTLITVPPAERTFAFEAGTLAADGALVREPREGRGYREDLGQGVAIDMVAIPGGTFVMGHTTADYPDELPGAPGHDRALLSQPVRGDPGAVADRRDDAAARRPRPRPRPVVLQGRRPPGRAGVVDGRHGVDRASRPQDPAPLPAAERGRVGSTPRAPGRPRRSRSVRH